MTRYTGKKAVVVGGTSGIGLGIASALLAEGGEVVMVTGRTEPHLATARSLLGSRGRVVRSDAASLSDIRELAGMVQRDLGPVDAVFLNAGYYRHAPLGEVSESEYERTFAINAKSVFFNVQQLAPHVRAGGAFVFTTSVANRTGYPGMSTYSAAKAAVRSFAQSFAAELLPRGIRVNAFSPGFVKTDTMGIDGASAEEIAVFAHEGERLTPLGRIASVEEVARAALFLAFDATFTTGEELTVDGGLIHITLPPAPG